MSILRDIFQDRKNEIDGYIRLLKNIDPREKDLNAIETKRHRELLASLEIDTEKRCILLASLFILMYNMIEAVMSEASSFIVEEICKFSEKVKTKVKTNGKKFHEYLKDPIRHQWILSCFDNNITHNSERRIKEYDKLYQAINAKKFIFTKIKKSRSGNWDDKTIEKFAKVIGVKLNISDELKPKVKEVCFGYKQKIGQYKNEQVGIIGYIRIQRNRLAHGEISFSECGNIPISYMNDIYETLKRYLDEVIGAFENFIEQKDFVVDKNIFEDVS